MNKETEQWIKKNAIFKEGEGCCRICKFYDWGCCARLKVKINDNDTCKFYDFEEYDS